MVEGHNAPQGERQSCLAAGMDDFLSKPMTAEALTAVLTRWLPISERTAQTLSPNSPTDTTPVLDRTVLEDILGMPLADAADVVLELIGLYQQNASDHYATLRAALLAEERRAMQAAAHAIAGSSANLGLTTLAQQCKQLEALAVAELAIDAATELSELEPLYEVTQAALADLRQELLSVTP